MKRGDKLLTAIVVFGCLWRIVLSFFYSGWEESDYGNLAMVYGVWESNFTHYDMNHMPGYYFFSALWLFFIDDTIVAAKLTSILGGCLSFVGITYAMRRSFGFSVAIITALLLMIQPEFSLYSASSLREPLYTAFLLGAYLAVLQQRTVLLSVCAVLAFSVRFEAPLFLFPIGVFYLSGWRNKALFGGILSTGIALWMLYCWNEYETIQFWSHAAAVNVETGLGAEQEGGWSWFLAGAKVVWGLLTQIVPSRLSWPIWISIVVFPMMMGKRQEEKILYMWTILMLGVWLAIAFIAQHEPQHNLYWKWLYPVIPFLGAVGGLSFPRLLRIFLSKDRYIWLAMVYIWWVQGSELTRQYRLSEQLYQPQVELGQWIEENIDPDTPMIVDNIPACWIGRQPNEYTFHSWFDVPHFPSKEAFAAWVLKNDVQWVLFFQEEWTKAPEKAPFLRDGGVVETGDVRLEEVRREDRYGWIWFRVEEGSNPRVDPVEMSPPEE